MDAQYITRDNTPKSVFNPLDEEFVDEIRDDDNKIKKYVVPSLEIVGFPTYLADRIINDLITAVMNARKINPQDQEKYLEIKAEIEV